MVRGNPIRAQQVFDRMCESVMICMMFMPHAVSVEEKYGTSDGVAKAQGMLLVVSKRKKVDQETGQVEGEFCMFKSSCSLTATNWDPVFPNDEHEANPTLQDALLGASRPQADFRRSVDYRPPHPLGG